tara:strand:+ start:348 stop:1076 length:729 start_codon:yes stop_codon:yes gene_type:complete
MLITNQCQFDCRHAFMMKTLRDSHVAIKGGFRSGYSGEGPRGLSEVLSVLRLFFEDIEEYVMSVDFIDRINASCLLNKDLELLQSAEPVRPMRWFDYIQDRHEDESVPFHTFPLEIPFSLLDRRLIPLAVQFKDHPDSVLMDAYRMLEDTVRRRCGIKGKGGAKLFSEAFRGKEVKLSWSDLDDRECEGRIGLFTGAFMAYRNRRAHQSWKWDLSRDVREFMLINELFCLESEAIIVAADPG